MIELKLALFPDGMDKLPRLKDESAQAWTLNALGASYSLSGQPRQAVQVAKLAIEIAEKLGNKGNVATGLGNLAIWQLPTGALREAKANLRRRIALSQEIEKVFNEAVGHQELGRMLAYAGLWGEAEEELATSSRHWEKTNQVQGLCMEKAYRALRVLMMLRDLTSQTSEVERSSPEASEVLPQEALTAARRSLELADETARTIHPIEHDYVRAHWLLGAAYRVNSDLESADRHLTEALTRCRAINIVEIEADILLDLARLRRDEGNSEEALSLANETLPITERSGYVLQGADVHLLLAELALARGKEH